MSLVIKKKWLKILKILKMKKLTVACAESCTGGLISSYITSYSGASNFFKGSIIPYSNELKDKLLGIPHKQIKKNGSVSKKVAYLMATKLSIKTKANISISTTGIAGPTGATSLKPIGLIYVGISINKNVYVYKFNFSKKYSRKKIQKLTLFKTVLILEKLLSKL